MPYPSAHPSENPGFVRQARAFALALAVEVVLGLVVLALGAPGREHKGEAPAIVVALRSVEPSRDAAERQPQHSPRQSQQRETTPSRPGAPVSAPAVAPPAPVAVTPPPALLALSPSDMAAATIAAMPRPAASAPMRGRMGPVDTGDPMPDSVRVAGAGPHGEPLYAASWYREPYDDELRGYLSTASGPGWGLIACKTAPDFRVEDCIKLDEYPEGSNIARAVLAAAWQFRVRPPRLGGEPRIGDWVRIHIEYDLRHGRS